MVNKHNIDSDVDQPSDRTGKTYPETFVVIDVYLYFPCEYNISWQETMNTESLQYTSSLATRPQ